MPQAAADDACAEAIRRCGTEPAAGAAGNSGQFGPHGCLVGGVRSGTRRWHGDGDSPLQRDVTARAPGSGEHRRRLTDDRVTVGLIADGIHSHPTSLRLAVPAMGFERITLVT